MSTHHDKHLGLSFPGQKRGTEVLGAFSVALDQLASTPNDNIIGFICTAIKVYQLFNYNNFPTCFRSFRASLYIPVTACRKIEVVCV